MAFLANDPDRNKIKPMHWIILIAAHIVDICLLFTLSAKKLSGQRLVIFIMPLFAPGMTAALIIMAV